MFWSLFVLPFLFIHETWACNYVFQSGKQLISRTNMGTIKLVVHNTSHEAFDWCLTTNYCVGLEIRKVGGLSYAFVLDSYDEVPGFTNNPSYEVYMIPPAELATCRASARNFGVNDICTPSSTNSSGNCVNTTHHCSGLFYDPNIGNYQNDENYLCMDTNYGFCQPKYSDCALYDACINYWYNPLDPRNNTCLNGNVCTRSSTWSSTAYNRANSGAWKWICVHPSQSNGVITTFAPSASPTPPTPQPSAAPTLPTTQPSVSPTAPTTQPSMSPTAPTVSSPQKSFLTSTAIIALEITVALVLIAVIIWMVCFRSSPSRRNGYSPMPQNNTPTNIINKIYVPKSNSMPKPSKPKLSLPKAAPSIKLPSTSSDKSMMNMFLDI